jgi:alpha-glucosidase
MSRVWWEEAVVYEVYPRSFADGNGDGTGDLAGLLSRLDYLAGLGVDAIWLTPFYPSPLADGGYDVADYCDVDPRLGTLADFDALVRDTAALGIRVITDLVPNHCSAEHPRFRAALAAGPGSPERDWFIFRDGDGPPNNWRSMFGGPAWTQVADGQWYLHLFDSGQPDWNWRHAEVRSFFEQVIRFWLDRGVAGLRIDVAHGLFKDPSLPDLDNPDPSNHPSAYYHQPDLPELYRSWRAILDSYPGDRTAVGEVWYDEPSTLSPYLAPGRLPQVFNFQFARVPWEAAALHGAIDAVQSLSGGDRAPWVFGNHDLPRPVTRYGSRRARSAALLLLALPGSAYIYQGEELGLPEVRGIAPARRADPTFGRTGGRALGRDGCRVPIPWDAERNPRSWLPQPASWPLSSVAVQTGDPGSFLTLYRSALRLRRTSPALGAGTMTWLTAPPDLLEGAPDLLAFTREPGFTFAANLGRSPVAAPPHSEVLLASEPAVAAVLRLHGELPPGTAAWLSR